MKVYVAASIRRRGEARELAGALLAAGYMITSRWLWETGPNLPFASYPPELLRRSAVRDVADVMAADVLVLLANPPGYCSHGGGRHWETGLAYGAGKPVVVLGHPEHIFHYLPGVTVAQEMDDVLAALEAIRQESAWSSEGVERVYG